MYGELRMAGPHRAGIRTTALRPALGDFDIGEVIRTSGSSWRPAAGRNWPEPLSQLSPSEALAPRRYSIHRRVLLDDVAH